MPRYRFKEIKQARERAELIGRNQTIFDCTRVESYRLDKPTEGQISVIAERFNASLCDPLPSQEIKHIVRSIWKYVNKPKTREQKERFIEKQRERGKKSGQARVEKAQKLKNQAFIYFANRNISLQTIADKLEVSLRTIKGYKAEFKKVQRTKSGSPRAWQNSGFYKNKKETDIDRYLSDTFSLYAEKEDIEKIALCTIYRLLE